MIWSSVSDFFAMGGYAVYVWGSFGVTAAVMVVEVFWAKHAHKKAIAHLQTEAATKALTHNDWSA